MWTIFPLSFRMPWYGCLYCKRWIDHHDLYENHVAFPNYGQLHEPQATNKENLFITIQNHLYKKKKYYPSKCNRWWKPFIDGGFQKIGWRTNWRTPGNSNLSIFCHPSICYIYNQIGRSNDLISMRFELAKIRAISLNFCI